MIRLTKIRRHRLHVIFFGDYSEFQANSPPWIRNQLRVNTHVLNHEDYYEPRPRCASRFILQISSATFYFWKTLLTVRRARLKVTARSLPVYLNWNIFYCQSPKAKKRYNERRNQRREYLQGISPRKKKNRRIAWSLPRFVRCLASLQKIETTRGLPRGRRDAIFYFLDL